MKCLSGTVGATTLTVEQIASHNHDIKTLPGQIGTNLPRQVWESTGPQVHVTEYSGGSQPHTHTLSGTSGVADNLPPFYALSYIMRVS